MFNSTVTDTGITATSSGTPIIFQLDDKLIGETERFLINLSGIGIEPPYALLVGLVRISGARLHLVRDPHDPGWYDNLSGPLDRDQYHFDEAIFETIPDTPAEYVHIMRPILDQLANTAGQATSPIFDAEGRYIPVRR